MADRVAHREIEDDRQHDDHRDAQRSGEEEVGGLRPIRAVGRGQDLLAHPTRPASARVRGAWSGQRPRALPKRSGAGVLDFDEDALAGARLGGVDDGGFEVGRHPGEAGSAGSFNTRSPSWTYAMPSSSWIRYTSAWSVHRPLPVHRLLVDPRHAAPRLHLTTDRGADRQSGTRHPPCVEAQLLAQRVESERGGLGYSVPRSP